MPLIPIDVPAEACFNTARMMLNDFNQQLWTDAVLMPMMYQAHLELQQKLKSRASPVMRSYSIITVPALATGISGAIDDLTSPIQLWERPFGAPATSFQLMTETDVLPFFTPITQTMTWWAWIQDQLEFVGSTIQTDILVNYWRRIPVPNAIQDLIGIIDGEQYLSPRIAALAMASVGETETSSVAGALAESQLQFVLAANRGRAGQLSGTSPRP